MTRNTKIILMFAPLAVAFLGLFFVVKDLKSPVKQTDACRIMAIGPTAGGYRTEDDANVLYTSSGNPQHDVALACIKHGDVVINDFDVFITDIQAGDKATLRHTTYQYLPERWQLDISADEAGRRQARS